MRELQRRHPLPPMRLGRPEPTGAQRILLYGACYLLWILLIVLGYVVVWVIWRSAAMSLLVGLIDETDIDQRSVGNFVYLLSIVLMAAGLFVLVMGAEPYLRDGVRKGLLLRRFTRLAAPLGGLGVLGAVML
ncbi:MAG: hypothetical protein M3281_00675, partial [Chloroflexota bacterium]|nr:hypothetical protein [Chloroflexota bacterium]